MNSSSQTPLIKAKESYFLKSVTLCIRDLGFNEAALSAAARACSMSKGELTLICPNGTADVAALIWRSQDAIFNEAPYIGTLSGLKIREKITSLLNSRLDAAFDDETLAKHLIGFLALPHHLLLGQRLVWHTADIIWRLAGDKALDENHYSKRAIVSAILSTAAISRLSRGREAQLEQIDQNIEQVMAFETFKAKLPATPETIMTNILAHLGSVRYGRASASND